MRGIHSMKVVKMMSMIISLIFCMMGVFYLVEPNVFWDTKTLVEILFLWFGSIKIMGYASKDLYQLAFQYDLEMGLLLCVIAIILWVWQDHYFDILCITFGIDLFLDSLFKIRIAMDAKEFGISSWWITMGFSFLCILLSIGLGLRLLPRMAMQIRFVGVTFLFEGCSNLLMMLTMVKLYHYQSNQIDTRNEESEE